MLLTCNNCNKTVEISFEVFEHFVHHRTKFLCPECQSEMNVEYQDSNTDNDNK